MQKSVHEKIEDYLDDAMTNEERTDFENAMAADPTAAEELFLAQTLRRVAAEKASSANLKKTLAEVGADFFDQAGGEKMEKKETKTVALPEPSWRKKLLPFVFAIAASLAFFFFFRNQKSDLYESSRVFPVASFVEKGGEPSDEKADLAAAEAFFNQKKWTEAEAALTRAAAKNPAPETLFFLALAKMEAGKTADARTIFQKLQAEKTAFAADASWFEALAFLKDGDQKAAAELLKKQNTDRAAQLLKRLD